MPDAAKRLFAHTNAVRQRFERAAALLGPAWAEGSHLGRLRRRWYSGGPGDARFDNSTA
ncbi:helix-turn-helix domain-containing protein [Leucobacter ruminantium]|uniref:helix-turn-helix domain-containing protein n=1 Tax=Leucobacter ruminantium TaxID=1289170 RepID=UPI003C7C879A